MNDYLDSGRRTIGEGTVQSVSPMQAGGHNIFITREVTDTDGKIYVMRAFVHVAPEGHAVLASYQGPSN